MKKKIGILSVFGSSLLLMSGCSFNHNNPYGYPNAWASYDDQHYAYAYDEHGNPVYKEGPDGRMIRMKRKGSVAPYPFPAEPNPHEKKIYGVSKSEWGAMTPGQRDVVRDAYNASRKSTIKKTVASTYNSNDRG